MGLKFRGWGNLEKGIQSLGVSYSMLHAVLSHLKTRAKRDSAHTCEYFAKVTT